MPPSETQHAFWRTLGADSERLDEIVASLAGETGGTRAGRVARVDRGRFQLMTPEGTVPVATTGTSPVGVGDWCLVDGASSVLRRVLTRRTALVRQTSGARTEVQALAANIDAVMIVVPLDRTISPRQVERFLSLAWDSGATPVLVLTKSDLVGDDVVAGAEATVKTVSGDQPVLVVSVVSGDGMATVAALVAEGSTVALLGTSGSGKSSLINSLIGTEVVQTGAVRQSDAKGRHTTTWRELVIVPTGGALIDTPGLRELGMWIGEDGIDAAFADITDLEAQCRFNDCAHESEPGCAVQEAIANGAVDADRLTSHRKLLAEAAFAARKNDHRLAKEAEKVWKQRTIEGRRNARR